MWPWAVKMPEPRRPSRAEITTQVSLYWQRHRDASTDDFAAIALQRADQWLEMLHSAMNETERAEWDAYAETVATANPAESVLAKVGTFEATNRP